MLLILVNYGIRCGCFFIDMGYVNLVYCDYCFFGFSECYKLLFFVSLVFDYV